MSKRFDNDFEFDNDFDVDTFLMDDIEETHSRSREDRESRKRTNASRSTNSRTNSSRNRSSRDGVKSNSEKRSSRDENARSGSRSSSRNGSRSSSRNGLKDNSRRNSRNDLREEFSRNTSRKDSLRKKVSSNRKKPAKQLSEKEERKKKLIKRILLVVCAIIIAFGVFLLINFIMLKSNVSGIKNNLKATLECVKEGDSEGADKYMDKVRDNIDGLEGMLDSPIINGLASMVGANSDIKSGKKLIAIFRDADKEVIVPLLEKAKEVPFTELKAGDGVKISVVKEYVDFISKVSPKLAEYIDEIKNLEFRVLKNTSVGEYINKVIEYEPVLDSFDKYADLLNVICGDGEDRNFLLLAQNSAEIRASGGYPGACGILKIENGVIDLEDFGTVRDYMVAGTAPGNVKSENEKEVFGVDFMWQDWDACYNPNFPRVAEISLNSFEAKTGKKAVGVISLTPAIIQEALAVTGDTITLSDGKIVNGENAISVIQRDLYYDYHSLDQPLWVNDEIVDTLFAETASQTIKSIKKNMSVECLLGYFKMIENGFNERKIMVWSKDEIDEDFLKNIGASGSVNFNSNKPEVGIFFSNSIPSKIGMYTKLEYTVGEPKENKDGELEYKIKATFTNTATDEDIKAAPYVIGTEEGAMCTHIQLFAPKGGTIKDVKFGNQGGGKSTIYELEVAYEHYMRLKPGESMDIEFTVTTKEGVTEPLKVVHTPTLQEYIKR